MKKPQQARSRETQRRLFRSARIVIAKLGFEGASVAGIAEHAGLSVGAFYQRFENKETLLAALHEETVNHNISGMGRAFDPVSWEGKSAFEVIEELVGGLIRVSRRDIGFQRACYQRALTDKEFAEREALARRVLAETVTPLLLDRLPPGRPKRTRRNEVNFCLTMITGVTTDFDVAAAFPIADPRLSREELGEGLIEACCGILGIDAHS